MTCQGLSCAQGRQPCTTPHTCNPPAAPRSCATIGVCQGRTPPCAGCHTAGQHDHPLHHHPHHIGATSLHQTNSDGSHPHGEYATPTPLPWEWIDDLRDFAVLSPLLASAVCVAAMSLGALVGWVLKG